MVRCQIDVRDINTNSISRRDNIDLGIPDFYVSYLWNYCSGEVDEGGREAPRPDSREFDRDRNSSKKSSSNNNSNNSSNSSKEQWKITRCSNSKAGYTFNVENIIQNDAERDIRFPKEVEKVQKAVNVVSKFMVACYVIGAIASIVTFCVGWFGLLSRWGSCVTTIFADVGLLPVPVMCCWLTDEGGFR